MFRPAHLSVDAVHIHQLLLGHVLEVAEKLCHQIAIIKDGRLIKNGLTAELVGDSSLEDVFLELEGEKE